MDPLTSTIISGVFLLSGAVAVFTMMFRQGRPKTPDPKKYSTVHRISGSLFLFLYLVMFVSMVGRIGDFWEESSSRINMHVTLAIALFFLLLLKATIPRFFPVLGKHLFALGSLVFLTSFSLVGITGGYYIIWSIDKMPYIAHGELPQQTLDTRLGQELFFRRCSICHALGPIMKPRSAGSWESVVNEMVSLAQPRIAPGEARQILHYLIENRVPRRPDESGTASPVEKHCLPCHSYNEIYQRTYRSEVWREILEDMHQYGPELVPVDKFDEIISFLVRTQGQ